ncbi:MAG: MgtC/SapB family protein [Flavobacteriales bacterium]|nr:MgtC/SapB family protein [Flavobacteriales bacterium]MEB2342266.1 MgtC/SapB family protein [Flavobacteriia bacterium]
MIGANEIMLRLALAALFGGLIGLERERKDWAAGLRTHMMVCVGSCLVVIVSAFGFGDILGAQGVELDPSRIAAQVVSGVGFIGAGAILFSRQGTIRGLTTAAGLWTVAAIGLATGSGLYFAAAATTVVALIILWAIQPLEKRYLRRFKQATLRVVTEPDANQAQLMQGLMRHDDAPVEEMFFEKNGDEMVYELKYTNRNLESLEALVEDLRKNPKVKEIFWAK